MRDGIRGSAQRSESLTHIYLYKLTAIAIPRHILVQTTADPNLTTGRTCTFLVIWIPRTPHDNRISLNLSPVIRTKKWAYTNNHTIRTFSWMPPSTTTSRAQLPPITRKLAPNYNAKRWLLQNVKFACTEKNRSGFGFEKKMTSFGITNAN